MIARLSLYGSWTSLNRSSLCSILRSFPLLINGQAKQDFAENDAIIDDVAGHAYIEQFGQETFQRAENAMKANKASRYLIFVGKFLNH